MTSDNDFCVWRWHYRERYSCLSVNAQTIAHNAPRIRALITSRNDRHVWTDRNSFTGMSTEMIKKMLFSSCFCQKNTHKTHEIVNGAVIDDNNNFAPSFFRSLCEFVGDCFGPPYSSSGDALPQKNTSVRFHTMTSKKMVRSYYCLINIIIISNYVYHNHENGVKHACKVGAFSIGKYSWITKELFIDHFSHCIDQAGLGAFTAKSGRKHYNPPPLTVMWMNFDSPNFPSFCSLSAIISFQTCSKMYFICTFIS